jgi:hypothetical protein
MQRWGFLGEKEAAGIGNEREGFSAKRKVSSVENEIICISPLLRGIRLHDHVNSNHESRPYICYSTLRDTEAPLTSYCSTANLLLPHGQIQETRILAKGGKVGGEDLFNGKCNRPMAQ